MHGWSLRSSISGAGGEGGAVSAKQGGGRFGLDKGLTELIKIRASQMNGCAFCLQFHLNLARKAGVSQTKLDLVAVWRDAGMFTGREMAALGWTEALTRDHAVRVLSDEAYATARTEFARERACVSDDGMASINAWNRIAMAYRFTPPVPQEGDDHRGKWI